MLPYNTVVFITEVLVPVYKRGLPTKWRKPKKHERGFPIVSAEMDVIFRGEIGNVMLPDALRGFSYKRICD